MSDTEYQPSNWYNAWMASEVNKLPPELFQYLKTGYNISKGEERLAAFKEVFRKVADYIITGHCTTLDDVVSQLFEDGTTTDNIDDQGLRCVRCIVFSILGWQTMLFRPAPMGPNPDRFTIDDEQDGYRGQAYLSLQQNMDTGSRETLSELLMGFGMLLPSKNLCLSDDTEEQKAFHQQLDINAKRFNANLLVSVAGIRIKWTDSLACHMEYNPAMKELYLFRFPSFCLSCLRESETVNRSVIHACATSSHLHCQWATEADIDHLLHEILLSYCLLFGQSKKSRILFRSTDPFARCPSAIRDPLLSELCTTRSCCILNASERETYYLPRDFPILRYRISTLQRHLAKSAPRTWTQLWRDKRDSANWLTFWALIAFGALGVLLALLQVILQFVETVRP